MAEPAKAGLTLSYAPTQRALTSPVIQVDESGALLAAIPAGALWPQLLNRALYLVLAIGFSTIIVGMTAILWRGIGADSPAPYVSTALAALMLLWVAACIRGIIVMCRFGHRPTTITVSATEVTVTYVSDRGPRTRSWSVEEVVGLLLKEHGKSLGKRTLWEVSVVASWPTTWDVFHLHFFSQDTEFPRRLDAALGAALDAAKRRRAASEEGERQPEGS
jgi:hypothetical protein